MRELAPDDPAHLGGFRLSARLGSGGMGTVYLGTAPDGTRAAVKAVRPEFTRDPGFRSRFAREVALARSVGGPHVPAVLDADADGPIPWLASEYIPGPTLEALVRSAGPLPEESLRALASVLAAALGSIHAEGMVHRDLKPANVLLSPSGPKIIDFGIARAMEDTRITRTGEVIGTPGFMAPELVAGDDPAPASDVFALGGVLVFAATGTGPFGTGPAAALLYRIAQGTPRLDGVPASLRPPVAACLARNPADRPTTADLVRSFARSDSAAAPVAQGPGHWLPAEAAALVEHSVAAPRPSTGPPDAPPLPRPAAGTPRPPVLRSPGRAAAAAGGLVLLLAASLLGDTRPDRPAPSAGSAPEDSRALSGTACWGGDAFPATEVERSPSDVGAAFYSAALSPDGHVLAISGKTGLTLWNWRTETMVARLNERDDRNAVPVFAPDGCTVFAPTGSSVTAYDLVEGAATAFTPSQARMAAAMALAQDGSTLTIGQGDGAIGLWDTGDRRQTATLELDDHYTASVARFSPDGDRLAVGGEFGAPIEVWDLPSADKIAVINDAADVKGRPVAFTKDGSGLIYQRRSGLVAWDLQEQEVRTEYPIDEAADADFDLVELRLDPEGERLFVHPRTGSDNASFDVIVFDVRSGERLSDGETPPMSRSIGFNAAGTRLSALDPTGSKVHVLDAGSLEVLGTVE